MINKNMHILVYQIPAHMIIICLIFGLRHFYGYIVTAFTAAFITGGRKIIHFYISPVKDRLMELRINVIISPAFIVDPLFFEQ